MFFVEATGHASGFSGTPAGSTMSLNRQAHGSGAHGSTLSLNLNYDWLKALGAKVRISSNSGIKSKLMFGSAAVMSSKRSAGVALAGDSEESLPYRQTNTQVIWEGSRRALKLGQASPNAPQNIFFSNYFFLGCSIPDVSGGQQHHVHGTGVRAQHRRASCARTSITRIQGTTTAR